MAETQAGGTVGDTRLSVDAEGEVLARAQVPDFDDLPESSAARREYAGLARSATRAMRVIVISGLVALFLS